MQSSDDKTKPTSQTASVWNVERVNAHIHANRDKFPWGSLAAQFAADSDAGSCLRAVCDLLDAKRNAAASAKEPLQPQKKKRKLVIAGRPTAADIQENENVPPVTNQAKRRKYSACKAETTLISPSLSQPEPAAPPTHLKCPSTMIWYMSRVACFAADLLGLQSDADVCTHLRSAEPLPYSALGILARLAVYAYHPTLSAEGKLPSTKAVMAIAEQIANAASESSHPIDVSFLDGRKEGEWVGRVRRIFRKHVVDVKKARDLLMWMADTYLSFANVYHDKMQSLVALKNVDLSQATPNKRRILQKAVTIERACQDLCDLQGVPGVEPCRIYRH